MPVFVSLLLWFLLSWLTYALAQRRLAAMGGLLARLYGALVAVGAALWLTALVMTTPGTLIGGLLPILLIQPAALLVVHAAAAFKPASGWLLLGVSMMTANLAGTACLLLYYGIAPSVGHIAGFVIGILLVLPVWIKSFRKTGQPAPAAPL